MKKLLLIWIVPFYLLASQMEVEQQIYQTILQALFPDKSVVKVWSDEVNKEELFASMENVIIVQEKRQADILMLFHTTHVESSIDTPIFASGYLVFQRTKGKAIGGFYWQKGRPNLIFIRKKLQEDGITLSEDLKKYIEDME